MKQSSTGFDLGVEYNITNTTAGKQGKAREKGVLLQKCTGYTE